MKIKELLKKVPKKLWLIIIGAIILILLIIFTIIMLNKDGKITDSDIEGYKTYTSKNLNISFVFPKDYKVKKEDNIFFISKKGNQKTKPYFLIEIIYDQSNVNDYINEYTKNAQKEFGNAFTPITESLASLIGDKYTVKRVYNNYYNDELIVETRYAYASDNNIYTISSYELTTISEEVNEISKNIITSLSNN